MARRMHMGRPAALNRDQQREALTRKEAGEALTDIARTCGVVIRRLAIFGSVGRSMAELETK
jgi:hypothetical protein